ncbi:MAG: hypothetical protein AAFR51_02525 [Pseudomonadota bacterium]
MVSPIPLYRSETYAQKWQAWVDDPRTDGTGLIIDHTPSGPIQAPPNKVRVCLYHIDFDERPTCYLDVNSKAEATFICEHFHACRGNWNVDYALAFDEHCKEVAAFRIYQSRPI